MTNQFTETTRKGWFSRIGGALTGVLVGIILIFVAIGLLGWNENRAVRTERALNEGSGVVVSVASDAIDPENNGQLIHVSGDTATQAPVTDPEFGVSAQGLRLVREVEMYQWRETSQSETRTKLGGGEETVTTYSYDRVWSDTPQDSSGFRVQQGHQNPAFRVEASSFTAQDARLGAFDLDDRIIERVGGGQPLNMDDETQNAVRARVGRDATVSPTTVYLGRDANSPQVGDTRISYEVIPADVISVVAAQANGGFEAYRARNGERVLLVSDGEQSAEQMFSAAQDSNRFMLWIIRIGGIIALITAFGMILNPLKVLADVVPFFGTIVGMGTGLIAAILGFLTGAITIAIAWFAVRPIVSVLVLLVAVGIGFLLWRLGRGRLKKTQAAAVAADPAPTAAATAAPLSVPPPNEPPAAG